jgi:hypothetical protein
LKSFACVNQHRLSKNKKKIIPCYTCVPAVNVNNVQACIEILKLVEYVLNELGTHKTTKEGLVAVNQFKSTHLKCCNDAKTELLVLCDKCIYHREWCNKNVSKLEEHGIMVHGETSNTTLFSEFAKLYQSQAHFRDGLLMGWVKCVVTRHDGHANAKACEKMIAPRIRSHMSFFTKKTKLFIIQGHYSRPKICIFDVTHDAIKE